jgi:hypothetical protein
MDLRQWSTLSLALYIFIGLLFVFQAQLMKMNSHEYVTVRRRRISDRLLYFYNIFMFLILVFIASFRSVQYSLGGYDAFRYVASFKSSTSLDVNFDNIINFSGREPLYTLIEYLMRQFTDNHIIFFILIYGIIVFLFMKFVSNNYDYKYMSVIPLVYLALPYIYSFNVIRNYLALAIVLLSIIKLKEKKEKTFLLLTICAALIHYTAIIMLVFYAFYKILLNKERIKKKRLLIAVLTSSLLAIYAILPWLKQILLESAYRGFLDPEYSLWGYLPIIILVLLSLKNYKLLIERMKNGNEIHLYLVIFNCVLLPIIILIGGSRLSHYFLFSRVIVWGYLINIFMAKYGRNIQVRLLLNLIAIVTVLSWLVFRIHRTWYSYALMPYINSLINNIF